MFLKIVIFTEINILVLRLDILQIIYYLVTYATNVAVPFGTAYNRVIIEKIQRFLIKHLEW